MRVDFLTIAAAAVLAAPALAQVPPPALPPPPTASQAIKPIGNLPGELDKFVPPPTNPTLRAPAKPDTTYDKTYTIRLGGKTARLSHYSPAHTGGDTIVFFPDLKVVAMGDELNAATPNIDYAGSGQLAGFIHSLDQTLKLDWDKAVPGHGAEPWTRAQFKAYRDKLQALLDRARTNGLYAEAGGR